MIFQSLFSYWGGKYSDKLGRKPLLILVGYLSSILFVVYTLIQTLAQLYILQAIFGILGAIQDVVSIAFLGDITEKTKRGIQIGKYKTVIGIFAGLALIASCFIIGRFGFEIIFYTVALFGIASTTLLFLIKETMRKKR